MQKYKGQSKWKQARSCTRKHKYVTEEEALQAMYRAKVNGVYECSFCGGWHITNSLVVKKRAVTV